MNVSEAARVLGVNRRTIQRWVKAGRVYQYPSGHVVIDHCVKQMDRRHVGRPAKGKLWENPLYWRVKGTLAAEMAEPFLNKRKLAHLKAMLAVIAFWHVEEGSCTEFSSAIEDVCSLAKSMHQKKTEGDFSRKTDAALFIERQST